MPLIGYNQSAGSNVVVTLTAVVDHATGVPPTLRDAVSGSPRSVPVVLWDTATATPVDVVGSGSQYDYTLTLAATGGTTTVAGVVTTPTAANANPRPASQVVTLAQAAKQCQTDATDPDEAAFLADLIDAATEYAEQALSASLLTRTITATFEVEQTTAAPLPFPLYGYESYGYWDGWWPTANQIDLTRGPVQAVTSVVDRNGVAVARFRLGRVGCRDLLEVCGVGWCPPLTVTYVAGYGPSAADGTADIRMAIRTHVASLWRDREAVADGPRIVAPLSLDAFYARKRRSVPVA